MDIKKTIIYMIEWILPSSTAIYIIVSQKILWGTLYFWGYGMNIPSYLIACTVGAIIFYPVNKYIFKHDRVLIIIDGKKIEIKNGDKFITIQKEQL